MARNGMHANTSGLLSQKESGDRWKGTFSRENTGWARSFSGSQRMVQHQPSGDGRRRPSPQETPPAHWHFLPTPVSNPASPLAFPTDARFKPRNIAGKT